MDRAAITEAIRGRAGELGFDLVGMIPVSPSLTHGIYREWLVKGYAGKMSYLERHLPLKKDPRGLLPETKFLISLGLNYYTADSPHSESSEPSRGRVSRYAWGEDYHDVANEKLEALRQFLHEELGVGSKSRAYVDSGPLLEREYAHRAGLGWIGKHTNLIHWKKGSWFFLAELLVDFPLVPSSPFTRVDCGSCTRCIDACPTDAIIAERELDARRCISYLTIELKGAIPAELREKMGNRIFGCDVCQEVCPWNKRPPVSENPKFKPGPGEVVPELPALMRLAPETFKKRFKKSPLLRAKRKGLLRNVAVALGNWGHTDAIPALKLGLRDTEPLVRAHSAWGLGRIPHNDARFALAKAKESETHEEVLREIQTALAE